MVLDQAGWHASRELSVPANITLLRRALETASVKLIDPDDQDGPGVRVRGKARR
jgi:hypothetical protein